MVETLILNVAVIGSSGGDTATLGHTDPMTLLRVIHQQLVLCKARIVAANFVVSDGGKGMDGIDEDYHMATLYGVEFPEAKRELQYKLTINKKRKGILRTINNDIRAREDENLARLITNGSIHGLICISCHPLLYQKTLQAVAATKIPVTGSGGTSLAQLVSLFGLTLIGNAGGSVATTTYSRAVSYTYALANYWNREKSYKPWIDNQKRGPVVIQWTSLLSACLPAFWGVCICKYILCTCCEALSIELKPITLSIGSREDVPLLLQEINFAEESVMLVRFIIIVLENWALPTACCVIAATSLTTTIHSESERDQIPLSSLLIASVLACSVCWQSVLGGLVAGVLVRQIAVRLLFWCVVNNIPATMSNLLGGAMGCCVAIILIPLAQIFRRITACIRFSILWTILGLPSLFFEGKATAFAARLGIGFLWGCLCCYGSKVGWYHAFFLPILLIEMENGDPSFFGAIDELTLVLVCAGICAGNLALRKLCLMFKLTSHRSVHEADALLCYRGLKTNLLYGDFAEACYPFMEHSTIINAGGYLASGLSSAWLVASSLDTDCVPKSQAYLPLPLSIALAGHQRNQMLGGSAIAFTVSFVSTFIDFLFTMKKGKVR